MCFLDISKGFDKVNCFELLVKLMKRRTPLCLIKLLHYWFSVSQNSVKWLGHQSEWYSVKSGVRQGGVLSPLLFAVYVDDMLNKLKGYGCKYNLLKAGAFMYADDLVLLSSSIAELKRMLVVCKAELDLLDLKVNVKKCKSLRIGKRYKCKAEPVCIDGLVIQWQTEAKYLGVTIISASKFRCNFQQTKSKFYRAANAILAKLGKIDNVTITLFLIARSALPILTYGIEALRLSNSELNSLNHPWHSCLCKIFRSFDNALITDVCKVLGYKSVVELYSVRVSSFLKSLRDQVNSESFVQNMCL